MRTQRVVSRDSFNPRYQHANSPFWSSYVSVEVEKFQPVEVMHTFVVINGRV